MIPKHTIVIPSDPFLIDRLNKIVEERVDFSKLIFYVTYIKFSNFI